MAGRTYEQNPYTGKWISASDARAYRAGLKQSKGPFKGKFQKEIEQSIGASSKFPEGRYTTEQLSRILRSGDKAKVNEKGKVKYQTVTAQNKADILSKPVNARIDKTGEAGAKNFLVAAGGGGAKEQRGTTVRLRGKEGSIKKT
ncbi:MAG: hypothetical protein EB163_09670, partial [Nitrososphaeria archaeon]|nr:hypothetical protein [Nitrososphaeria archaeon]